MKRLTKGIVRFIKNIIFYRKFLWNDYHDDWSSGVFVETLLLPKFEAYQDFLNSYQKRSNLQTFLDLLRESYLEPWHEVIAAKYNLPLSEGATWVENPYEEIAEGKNYFELAEEYRSAYFAVMFDMLEGVIKDSYGYTSLAKEGKQQTSGRKNDS